MQNNDLAGLSELDELAGQRAEDAGLRGQDTVKDRNSRGFGLSAGDTMNMRLPEQR